MNCAWNELLSVLPQRLRPMVDRLGKQDAHELRLRLGKEPQMIFGSKILSIPGAVSADELNYVINVACRYSPWTAGSAAEGYLTVSGGHRIGICGEIVEKEEKMTGFRTVRSVNIRIARDFPGIAKPLADLHGNLLLLGPPGSGKTTLLRDLIRLRSMRECVAVVDERGELFPQGLCDGKNVDILTACPKPKGVEMLLRTMGPDTVAVDEITAAADCDALLQAGWCGVGILATVHGSSREDLLHRRVYRPIVECGLFDQLVILGKNKDFRVERMGI
jgi:stage III sporulation protein AA